jgi:hypothetical protein
MVLLVSAFGIRPRATRWAPSPRPSVTGLTPSRADVKLGDQTAPVQQTMFRITWRCACRALRSDSFRPRLPAKARAALNSDRSASTRQRIVPKRWQRSVPPALASESFRQVMTTPPPWPANPSACLCQRPVPRAALASNSLNCAMDTEAFKQAMKSDNFRAAMRVTRSRRPLPAMLPPRWPASFRLVCQRSFRLRATLPRPRQRPFRAALASDSFRAAPRQRLFRAARQRRFWLLGDSFRRPCQRLFAPDGQRLHLRSSARRLCPQGTRAALSCQTRSATAAVSWQQQAACLGQSAGDGPRSLAGENGMQSKCAGCPGLCHEQPGGRVACPTADRRRRLLNRIRANLA